MNDRWAYPTPMGMQRQTGSAPKARDLARDLAPALPNALKSPPVAPETETSDKLNALAVRSRESGDPEMSR